MKNLNNKTNKFSQIVVWISLVTTLPGCASYKATWDCPKVKGIGCSSLEYADEIARKQILLNTGEKQKKEVLIRKNETNFEEAELY